MVIVICFYNECIGVKIIKHLFNRQNFIFIVRSGLYVCAEWEMGGLYFRKTVDKISYPHQIVIDLGEKQKITDFRYLPRAEKGAPGQIRKYKIYISDGFKL